MGQQQTIAAITAARKLFNDHMEDAVIFDSETTSKYPSDARIVDIAIINLKGEVLLNTLVHPGMPIPPETQAIHGIGDEHVKNAPTFAEIYDALRTHLFKRTWVIYNAGYDAPIIDNLCGVHGLPPILRNSEYCAMKQYAQFYGDWNQYRSQFKWQKLSAAVEQCGLTVDPNAHRALADCSMTLQVLRHMAAQTV